MVRIPRSSSLSFRLAAIVLGACSFATAADNADQVPSLLKDAATEVSYLSFERALPLFQQAGKLVPEGSDQWQQAIFGQAVCLQQATPASAQYIAQATQLYKLLAEKYPTGRYTPQALMALGRIAELVDYLNDTPDRPAARDWYDKARQASGLDTGLGHEATLRIAATYVQEMDADSVRKGIAILTDWLARYPKNPLASAMWQYAGNSYQYPLNDQNAALDCYLKADALGLLEQGREGPLYWRMANLAERTGRLDIAIGYYTRIIQKTPTSGKAYESQLALKRLGAPVPQIRLFRAGDAKPATAPATGESQTSVVPAANPVEKP